jgi:hypothetical protein
MDLASTKEASGCCNSSWLAGTTRPVVLRQHVEDIRRRRPCLQQHISCHAQASRTITPKRGRKVTLTPLHALGGPLEPYRRPQKLAFLCCKTVFQAFRAAYVMHVSKVLVPLQPRQGWQGPYGLVRRYPSLEWPPFQSCYLFLDRPSLQS